MRYWKQEANFRGCCSIFGVVNMALHSGLDKNFCQLFLSLISPIAENKIRNPPSFLRFLLWKQSLSKYSLFAVKADFTNLCVLCE